MIEHKLREASKMAELFETCDQARALIKRFSQIFFQVAHAEGFDPRTMEFDGMVPTGEPDKIVLTLSRALYLTEPLQEVPVDIKSTSYKLVRYIKSFYASFLAENGWMSGFVENCPGFCDCVFMIMRYILTRYEEHKKVNSFQIVCGDNAASDLVFYIYMS